MYQLSNVIISVFFCVNSVAAFGKFFRHEQKPAPKLERACKILRRKFLTDTDCAAHVEHLRSEIIFNYDDCTEKNFAC